MSRSWGELGKRLDRVKSIVAGVSTAEVIKHIIITSCWYKLWKENMRGVIWQRNNNEISIYILDVIPSWIGNRVVEARQGYVCYTIPELPDADKSAEELEKCCRLNVERYRAFRMSQPTRCHISKADSLSLFSISRYLICHFFIAPLPRPFNYRISKKRKVLLKALKSEGKKTLKLQHKK